MGFLNEDRRLSKEHGESENNDIKEGKRDDSDGSQEIVGTTVQTDTLG
jgi:hypothetical protein